MENFGFALRLAREKKGLTQKQVMALTGINNKTLSGYENGVSEPDMDTLDTLLKLYGVSAGKLFGAEGCRGLGELTRREEKLLRLFQALSEAEQEECLQLLKTHLRCREGGKG